MYEFLNIICYFLIIIFSHYLNKFKLIFVYIYIDQII
jgi:hypothetical protein